MNRLPNASAFGEAVADDEDYAAAILALPDTARRKASGPRVSDFSPEVALLAQLVEHVQVVVSRIEWVGTKGKSQGDVVPVPRPVTALDRLLEKARKARMTALVDEVLEASTRRGGA